MTEYLVYVPDPYGVGNARFAIATSTTIDIVPAGELNTRLEAAVTYDAGTLIDNLRREGARPPRVLIDIGEAIRLKVGLSKSDGGEQKWDFWKQLKSHFNTAADWRRAKALHEGRELLPAPQELLAILGGFANALNSLWVKVQTELDAAAESQRFWEIEVPVAQIFYERQLRGIAIESTKASAALNGATDAKYDAYRSIADILQISPTGLTYWNVQKLLSGTDAPALDGNIEGYALRDQLKLASEWSQFARSFTEYQSASRDVSVLTRLLDASERVYPTFHPFGTISGRILVSDPFLQELRRRFRSVLIADEGRGITYFDYSQFEPGVMASLSGDEDLLDLYNSGDVYSALSTCIFGSIHHRDLAKKVFLAFSYGMSAFAISNLIADGKSGSPGREAIEHSVLEFFGRFQRLVAFRVDAERRLADSGHAVGAFGNHRRRTRKGPLTAKEKRWAMSHIIQSTASVIFKRALISIEREYGRDAMLLPMHDAIVMQFPAPVSDEASVRVSEIMKASFLECCPDLNVRVTVGPFG